MISNRLGCSVYLYVQNLKESLVRVWYLYSAFNIVYHHLKALRYGRV